MKSFSLLDPIKWCYVSDSFDQTFGICITKKCQLHMSQRATCYSCESAAVRWQTVARGCTFLTVAVSLKVWQRENTQMTDVAANSHGAVTLREPWPLWFSPPPPTCPSDRWGARPTGRHQSQQMVPVQSCCSQRPRDPRIHRSQQTLPLLQRSVSVCTSCWVCVALSSCLTPTTLHLLWLRPWNRWSLWERVLEPDLTSYLTIQTKWLWGSFLYDWLKEMLFWFVFKKNK